MLLHGINIERKCPFEKQLHQGCTLDAHLLFGCFWLPTLCKAVGFVANLEEGCIFDPNSPEGYAFGVNIYWISTIRTNL